MDFIVRANGDTDTGIDSLHIDKIKLPNPGVDEVEWEESCKDALKELYQFEQNVQVYTKQEWKDIENSDEDFEEED